MSERAITEQHQRIRQLVQVQKAAQVDLLRIEVRLAQIQEQLITERNRLAIQQRTMGVLLGLAQQSIQIDGQLDADTTTSVPLPVLSEVLTQRQDYQAASAGVEAQRHQLDAVKGANLPQISARASYGGRLGLDADHPDGVDDLEDVATVGIVGSVRLFDAGLNDAQILRQRFALSAGRQRLLELEQRIDLECQTAWLNVQAAVKRIGATSAAVRQADESLRIEREKYDQGKGTIVDILDAQAASLQAQTTYHRVLADRHIAQAQLQLATGAMP
jgi:outer membrane protein TolC